MSVQSAIDELLQLPCANQISFSNNQNLTEIIKFNEDFKQDDILGRGQYSVREFKYLPYRTRVAVKIIPKLINNTMKDNYNHVKQIINEIKALDKLRGRTNIVEFYGFAYHQDNIYIIMELLEYTLEDLISLIRKYPKLRKSTAVLTYLCGSTAMDMLHALDGCVLAQINHNDIKPANILYDKQLRAKLSDFGNSNLEGGTISYWSPNRFENPNNRGTLSDDLWSLGITLLDIFYDQQPILHHSGCPNLNYLGKLIEFMRVLKPKTLLSGVKSLKVTIKGKVSLKGSISQQDFENVESDFVNEFIGACLSREDTISLQRLKNLTEYCEASALTYMVKNISIANFFNNMK